MTINFSWLSGYKTYGIAFLIALVAIAQYMKWIDQNTAITLFGLLGAGGLAGTRTAITKASKNV